MMFNLTSLHTANDLPSNPPSNFVSTKQHPAAGEGLRESTQTVNEVLESFKKQMNFIQQSRELNPQNQMSVASIQNTAQRRADFSFNQYQMSGSHVRANKRMSAKSIAQQR